MTDPTGHSPADLVLTNGRFATGDSNTPFVNAVGVRGQTVLAVGDTKDTLDPVGGEIQRDRHGNPTGILVARPNAMILYATLATGPKLSPADQANSTRHFMREMNRLGVTSVIDAGGGFQNYPD